MREWLLAMADAGQCGMFFHSAEVMQQTMQRDIVIRCFLRSGLRPCGFRLSTNKSLCDIPVELQDVYELIDGTTEGDAEAFEPGGIESLIGTGLFSADCPGSTVSSDKRFEDAYSFFTDPCGNQVFNHDGNAYWLCHEDFAVTSAGSLDNFLNSYFRSFLSFGRLEPPLIFS